MRFFVAITAAIAVVSLIVSGCTTMAAADKPERAKVQLYRDTDQALRLLAAEHVAAGVEDAQKYIAQKPDDYVGYRIAADAARLRNQWKEFSENVAKVEEKNPDSNGLVFLRGVASQMRDGDARH